jgi:endoglucanase
MQLRFVSVSRVILFFVALCLALYLGLCSGVGKTTHAVPWLHVDGNWLKDPRGNKVVLRGVSTPDPFHLVTARPGIPFSINKMTDGGKGLYSKVIRIPANPFHFKAEPDKYFNSYLKPAVDYCVSKGVYVIIDWHYGGVYNTAEVDSLLRSFWSYVAPKFKDVPNVIYEVFNEPVTPYDWNTWKVWAQPWVDLIRSHAPNNIILVGSPEWSRFTRYAPKSPFKGKNLVYTIHIYPQHHPRTWESVFGAAAKSVPVFMTEWGYSHDKSAVGAVYYGTTSGFGANIRNFLDKVHPNISWAAWIYDWDYQPVMVDKNYNLLGGDNFMGVFTQKWLLNKRNSNIPR